MPHPKGWEPKRSHENCGMQEGRFPNDLKELVEKKYMPVVPTPPAGSKLDYDAKAGTVKIVSQ